MSKNLSRNMRPSFRKSFTIMMQTNTNEMVTMMPSNCSMDVVLF